MSSTRDSDVCSSKVGQVGGPHERGQVVDHAEVHVRAVLGRTARDDALGPYPVRPVLGTFLLVEELAFDAVRVALHRQRPALEVRQHERRHARVVVDHLALGEARLGIEDLVEVGELELLALDLDFDRFAHIATSRTTADAGLSSRRPL
jgi:hypothetical protein